jgi:DNA-binding response OmpR family regulator
MRILIINSSEDTCEMLEEYFRRHGWHTATCMLKPLREGTLSGAALMEIYQPDAILLDVAIPYERNWRTVQQLREDPNVTCPIVVTTSNAAVMRRLVPTDAHIQEIVGKPYDLDQLRQIFLRAIAGTGTAEGVPDVDRRRGGNRRVHERRDGSSRRDPDSSSDAAAYSRRRGSRSGRLHERKP